MRDWEERSWSEGIDPWDVIAQVGKKLAARYLSSSQAGDSLLLLAGPGHNGDDVRAMVPWLFQRRVELLSVNGKPEDLIRLETHPAQGPDAVIEGLFGIGLNRPLGRCLGFDRGGPESILRPRDIERPCVNGRWYHAEGNMDDWRA